MVPVCNLCYGLYIYQAQQWIRRRLQPDHFSIWPDSLLIGCDIACCHIGGLHIVAPHNPLKDAVAAAIEVIAGDYMVAGAEEAENGSFGGHTRGKGQPIAPIFEGSHTFLQCAARGVLRT